MAQPLPDDNEDGDQDAQQLGYEQIAAANEEAEESNSTEAAGNRQPNGSVVVTVNGMQFSVYGNTQGLDQVLASQTPAAEADNTSAASDEELLDEQWRKDADAAVKQALEADTQRRFAPLSPQRRQAVMDAMKGVTIGDFRPEWANMISDEQWKECLKNSGIILRTTSSSGSSNSSNSRTNLPSSMPESKE